MAAGMEIRIIEVPSQGNINTTPLSTSSEDVKSQIAQDVQNNTGSTKFELPNLTGALQNKIKKAFEKKEMQKKATQKSQMSLDNPTSQGNTSNTDTGSAAMKASAIIGAGSMGISFLANAAGTIFDNATIGASFGKYGGNQVALRKANNVRNTMSKVGNIGGNALQGAQLGAAFGPIGAAIGAVAGLAFGVANQALENSKAAKELAMQQAEWAAESTKALDRMGYNGGR